MIDSLRCKCSLTPKYNGDSVTYKVLILFDSWIKFKAPSITIVSKRSSEAPVPNADYFFRFYFCVLCLMR